MRRGVNLGFGYVLMRVMNYETGRLSGCIKEAATREQTEGQTADRGSRRDGQEERHIGVESTEEEEIRYCRGTSNEVRDTGREKSPTHWKLQR
jgi:hypothetical protein